MKHAYMHQSFNFQSANCPFFCFPFISFDLLSDSAINSLFHLRSLKLSYSTGRYLFFSPIIYHSKLQSQRGVSVCELYGKLHTQKVYSRHPGSLYRIFVKLGYRKAATKKKKSYTLTPYHTPTQLGVKWQMDVKYVSTSSCCLKACKRIFCGEKTYVRMLAITN